MDTGPKFVRFQSPEINRHGLHTGVFGLTNVLGKRGALTADDYQWWRESNAWCEATYTDPSTIDPQVYDKAINPRATAWFKTTAHHLLARVEGYLELLSRYGVECRPMFFDCPGRVVYEDEVQVVVVSHDLGGSGVR